MKSEAKSSEEPKNASPAISTGIKDLASSKILLVNTDTVPGLAVSPHLQEAVHALYALKGRSYQKPLVWMVDCFSRLAPELIVEEYAKPLIERYWPGKLTLVFNVKSKTRTYNHLEYLEKNIYQEMGDVASLNHNHSRNLNHNRSYSLGVRIPQGDDNLLLLLKALGAPLAVSSVNRSGETELTDLARIKAEFKEKISYTFFENRYKNPRTPNLDRLLESQVSTVVDVRTPELRVLRKGAVVLEIEK